MFPIKHIHVDNVFNRKSSHSFMFSKENLHILFIFSKTIFGFQLKVSGFSPTAARYAGFNQNTLVFLAFGICGAFAGIAGLSEVSGPIGLLYRDISPNYGFTAIIVAFLGRLHPIGIILASLVIALTYLGAEDAQLFMQIPAAVGFVFQGLVLFYLLGADLLVNYKLDFKGAPWI